MLSVNRSLFMICLFVITSILIGCAKVPADLALKIEDEIKKSNPEDLEDKFNLGLVTLFDSDNKEAKFFARELKLEKETEKDTKTEKETGVEFGFNAISNNALGDEVATAIKEVSSISILGLSEIVINNVVYNSCQYISIDNQNGSDLSRLICPVNRNQEKERPHLATNKVLDKHIVDELIKISGVEKIKFVVFNDYKTGRAEFFLANSDYFSPEVSFPLFLTKDPKNNPKEITNLNTWTVITYRQNPCKQCKVVAGKLECEYFKDKSNCSY